MASLEELLAVEVKNRPFLYDKGHALYNNRVAIDNAWTQIAIMVSDLFENPMECDEVKKHWKTLRDKYKRAKDRHDSIVEKSGGASTSSYFMKDQLNFLNDHLVDRKKSYTIKDKRPVIQSDTSEPICHLDGLTDDNYYALVNNQELKLENNDPMSCENDNTDINIHLKPPPTKKKKKMVNKDIASILDYIAENECGDEDLLFMRSLVPSLKLIKNSHTKSLVKMELMRVIHEGVFLNKVGDNYIDGVVPMTQ